MVDTKTSNPQKTEENKIYPRQEEMFLATVKGKETVLPEDLYVPPNALEVLLDSFAGPLDFLLYLIKKQNLDILDINVAKITEQYTSYIELMDAMQVELAGDYLVMAAYLAELKSRIESLECANPIPTFLSNHVPLSSGPRWLIAYQGLMRVGAANAVRGSSAPVQELRYIFDDSRSVGLIIQSSQFWEDLSLSEAEKGKLKFILQIEKIL